MHKVDLGIEVDTDPQIVANFLSKRTKGSKVLITTYQSGKVVSEGVKRAGKTFDLGVYDEAHKTVGQKYKGFAHLLYDENVKVKNRVFMTATEREFKGNSDEYLSMDNPEVYGKNIDVLSFKAALEQDPPILSDYKIVTTIVTKSEIEKLINKNHFIKSDGTDWTVEGGASAFASLITLRKLIKERKLKHVVSFHSSIKRSIDFQNLNIEASKADGSFGELSTFHVSGKDSTGKRAAELERFVDVKPSLITNARCLTEGVDVPAIDAVLFADPKQSKIDIVQAAGRALRKFEGKDFGYIIIPIVLDEGAENPSDDAFKQIITVISALGMSDGRIIEEFMAIANGGINDRARIVDINVPEIYRVKFEDFVSNIEIQIWDRLSFGWHKGFNLLKKHVTQVGHARVHDRLKLEGFSLGNWVSDMRKKYRTDKLSAIQIDQLEALNGWYWDPVEADFQDGFERVKTFVNDQNNIKFSQKLRDKGGYLVGKWIQRQRDLYRNGKLSSDHKKQVETIPYWIWEPLESSFQEGFNALIKYVEENKNARVPSRHMHEDFPLGKWVSSRREDYKKGRLDLVRIEQLETINGWTWDLLETDFQQGITELKNYISKYKNARVSYDYVNERHYKLGQWASERRKQFKKDKLSKERIQYLDSFEGWVWDANKKF